MSELLFSKLNLFHHIYNRTTSIKTRNLALIYRVNSMQSIILINSLWHFLFHILWYIFFINHFIPLSLFVSYLYFPCFIRFIPVFAVTSLGVEMSLFID